VLLAPNSKARRAAQEFKDMNTALHRHTPTLTTTDSRGLTLRHVTYHRAAPDEPPQALISRQQYDDVGNAIATWDARLNAASLPANQTSVFSLGGAALLTRNVDSGHRINRYCAAGEIKESWDSRGTHWQTDYDALLRPLQLREQGQDDSIRVIARFSYASPSQDAALHNRCGRLCREDDPAGTLLFTDYGLSGQPLSQTRHFLALTAPPDWPEDSVERDLLLEPGLGATTRWHYSPAGETLEQTDAAGNVQCSTYDVAGQLVGLALRTENNDETSPPHVLLSGVTYDVSGQITRQSAGNGVVSLCEYDPADGRLTTAHTLKPGHGNLQALSYAYDPVGNVVRIEDLAQTRRHFANQRIDPVNTYTYDSLYQLIRATGREALGATIGPQLPELTLTPGDVSQLQNYTQHYQYDSGGNMMNVRHVGHRNYTRRKAISPDSNRCLEIIEGRRPLDDDHGFDANGNLQALQRGQRLQWDYRNQLDRVVAVSRDEGDDDECYIYDGVGLRVRKIAIAKARNTTQVSEVRYLPGLEIRRNGQELLHVVTLQAGVCSVRRLHWVAGKPSDIDNDQLRYGFDDVMDSSSLELDQHANLLSHEGFYPYGGSAWWAARSALQARYKTIRYCGKERDASGLYYYGQRYYAPWLQQWINPDPAGTSDGLNLYRMVGNNPVTMGDADGQTGVAKQSGSNFGLIGLDTRRGRHERAERKAHETVAQANQQVRQARVQELQPLHDAVAIHREVLNIAKVRIEAAHQQLLNYTSTQEHVLSMTRRIGTIVAKSVIGIGAGIGGGAVGTLALPGAGTAIGAYAAKKGADAVFDYAAEKTGLSASVKLKTGSLSADKIFQQAAYSTVDYTGYAVSKARGLVPTTQKDVYKLAKDQAKSALGKAPGGELLKMLPEVPELVHESMAGSGGMSPEKAAKLDKNLSGLIGRIDDSLNSITSMFSQLNVDSVSTPVPGNLHRHSTAQSLSDKTLILTNRLRETQALGRQIASNR
jgi:insecticidal toxin complex protein TccC